MPTFEVYVSVKYNGREMEELGFPFRRRVETDEAQAFDTVFGASQANTDVGVTGQLAEVQVFAAKVDNLLQFGFNGSAPSIPVEAGGFIIIADADIDAGAATNVVATEANGNDVQVIGIAGGT